MADEEFDIATALEAAHALRLVLERRTHRKKYLGEEFFLPSTLGDAVNLPKITGLLSGRGQNQREKGLDEFQSLWFTLSEMTRKNVLEKIGWYRAQDLEWDDIRSNRHPKLKD